MVFQVLNYASELLRLVSGSSRFVEFLWRVVSQDQMFRF